MKKGVDIAIVGFGFSGLALAYNLIIEAAKPISLAIIEPSKKLGLGVAYSPYSQRHLLNVPASKMSLFTNKPSDYLEWLKNQPEYRSYDIALLGASYTPRYYYGKYLVHHWDTLQKLAKEKNITIQIIENSVVSINELESGTYSIKTNSDVIFAKKCAITTGNMPPKNPETTNPNSLKTPYYFQNPWCKESVENTHPLQNILIIGNGLTMVDTVLGLEEHHFKGKIYAISPNGFNILPHRHNGLTYNHITSELNGKLSLSQCVQIISKHIKLVRKLGITAEPIIDQFRPFTQAIWQNFSDAEKQLFMKKFRHLWGVARHRIPLHIHDHIQQLRIDQKLTIFSGTIIDILPADHGLEVHYLNKKNKKTAVLKVDRIINCTGPDTDFSNYPNHFLGKMIKNGMAAQDFLKLGINACTNTFRVKRKDNTLHPNLFCMGSLLRGMLWESTAVNELRQQASLLSKVLLEKN